MGIEIQKNSTTVVPCPRNATYPYFDIPASLCKLKGYKLAIMVHILSNKKGWGIVKDEIFRRMDFSENRFEKAWKELIALGYIKHVRKFGSYHYKIYEDPSYTGSDVEDCYSNTIGSSTGCTDTPLTNINNNYNTTTTGTDTTCLRSQFKELMNTYPSYGTNDKGKYYTKRNPDKCENKYLEYLKTGETSHEKIIQCLKLEVAEKEQSGFWYQPGLQKWIEGRNWEAYMNQIGQPAWKPYGSELL